MDLTPEEIRVLGCLVEKHRTTPDQYPLSLNALRLACNQATNRDPVVDYDEQTVRDAAQRLGRHRLARMASGAGSRAVKYRHLLDETLRLPSGQLAVLTVLMLRGPQTPGELKGRTERIHRFASLAEVAEAIDGLMGRGLAGRLERRPGQKEERYSHLLGTGDEAEATPGLAQAPPAGGLAGRVDSLEAEVRALREQVEELRRAYNPTSTERWPSG
ncbi:MAG TPA: YceH family protein [Thermoleophilaceae bacterium]|nr:YceH family protein [Thermoleophilaceae bacterium]